MPKKTDIDQENGINEVKSDQIDVIQLETMLNRILQQQEKIVKDQELFKQEVYDHVNKNQDQLKGFMDMLKPQIQTPQIADSSSMGIIKDEIGGYVDKDGVSWGNTIPPHMKPKAQAQPQNPLGINIAEILPQLLQIAQMFLNRPQQNNIMAELGQRAFFEAYQKSKIMDKAFNNYLFSKGLVSETDKCVMDQTTDIVNDPITKMIQSWHNPQPQSEV